ncbi:hypothetical protein CDAR_193401 [Caerostris darwini]|uniref:Uncharacterized protein n=1 Tax=Caerostris darwini TaxID=1538125 RepID=A0AAV4TNY7_9ARAC|nr:hypothetical protein CDAR_193401 [Caerostris darwini]
MLGRSFFRILEIDQHSTYFAYKLGGIQLVRPRIPDMPKRSFFRFLEIDQHRTYFAYKLGGIQLVRPRIPDIRKDHSSASPRNRPTQYLLRLQFGRNPTRTTSNPRHNLCFKPERLFFCVLEIDQHSTYFAYNLGGIQLVRPRIPDM